MAAKGSKKSGGRRTGTPNKRSYDAQLLAEKMKVDPLKILLMFAKRDWKGLGYDSPQYVDSFSPLNGDPLMKDVVTPDIQIKAASAAVKYLYSQKKAVKVSGPNGGPIRFGDNLTDEQIKARIKQLAAKQGKK